MDGWMDGFTNQYIHRQRQRNMAKHMKRETIKLTDTDSGKHDGR